jgi:hypothetical protein
MAPDIYETIQPELTPFEQAWVDLDREVRVLHYLQRVDVLSGIGDYGVLLLGLGDGKALDKPAAGIDSNGLPNGKGKNRLFYLRAFDRSRVRILELDRDPRSFRYGQPTMYLIKFSSNSETSREVESSLNEVKERKVHWTRIIHVADNRMSEEIFGLPRMEPVWNRLVDILKVAGGSAEMFWKGAFPGYSFEMMEDMGLVEFDKDSIREEFANYSNGLQRYMALEGVTAKPLPVQVADPESHIRTQILLISITLGVPARVLMGSEIGSLASAQDTKRWNERIARRQNDYVTPLLLRPFIDRLMALGVLPTAKYNVFWPDLNTPTELEKGAVAMKIAQTMSAYTTGAVARLMHPVDFMMKVLGCSNEEAEMYWKRAQELPKTSLLVQPEPPTPNTQVGGKARSKKSTVAT